MQLVPSDDPRLHQISTPVTEGEDISAVVSGMSSIMYEKDGVGLAAPQVGVHKRVIIIRYGAIDITVVNPTLTPHKSTKKVTSRQEGCLSFPGKRVNMKRYKRVTLEGFDVNWNPLKLDLRNFAAFIAQHECDHLDGVTIV